MVQFFISYSRADRQLVDQLVPLIRRVYGNDSVWFDYDIHGGMHWWQMILSEIGKCRLFVYLISNESLESPYCQAELREALRLNKQILPVIVRRLYPPYPGNIPTDLAAILNQKQYVDVSSGIRDANIISELYAALTHMLSITPQQQSTPKMPVPTPEPSVIDKKKDDTNIRGACIIGAILLISAVIVVVIGLSLLASANTPESTPPTNLAQLETDRPTETPSSTDTPKDAPTGTPSPTQTPTSTSTSTLTFTPSPTWPPTPTLLPTSAFVGQSVVTLCDGFAGRRLSPLWAQFGYPDLEYTGEKIVWRGKEDGWTSGIELGDIRVGQSVSVAFQYRNTDAHLANYQINLAATGCCDSHWRTIGLWHQQNESRLWWYDTPVDGTLAYLQLEPDQWYILTIGAQPANHFSIQVRTRGTLAVVYDDLINMGSGWEPNPYWVLDVKTEQGELELDFVEISTNLALYDDTPAAMPTSVNIAGDFLQNIGCPNNWAPDCSQGALVYNANSGLWENTIEIAAGSYLYKATINGTWDENYAPCGLGHAGNMNLQLSTTTRVTFTYDPITHELLDSINDLVCAHRLYQP